MSLVTHVVAALVAFGSMQTAAAAVEAKTKAIVLGAEYGLSANDFGYLVVDVADGTVVTELNADRPFIPASVAKIPTTVSSLDILGDDHHFNTTVFIDGEVVDGTLDGALTIRGGGDPLLSGDDLKSLAREIARSGITKVVGGYHYDATDLVDTPQISAKQPEAAGYNAGVSSLSVNFNRVRLRWRNGGDGPSGEASAISDNLTLPLDAIRFAPADQALPGRFVRAGHPSEDSWLLSPTLPPRGEDWLPVGNPALLTARMLRLLAAEEGVILPEPTPRAVGPGGVKEIARHQSVGLLDIAREVLRYSNNAAAELVGLATSRAVATIEKPLTLGDSAETLSNWWRSRISDTDWDGFFLENHSGLSSRSRTTPRQLVAILEYAANRHGNAELHDLLMAASWKAPNGKTVKIRAKTGTIAYGRGLAGYIDAVDGRRLAFAVFFNDLQRRAALDAAFDSRAETDDPEWRPWRSRALKMEEMLLNGWATGSWK